MDRFRPPSQGRHFLLWDEGQHPSFGTSSPLVVLKGTMFLTPLAICCAPCFRPRWPACPKTGNLEEHMTSTWNARWSGALLTPRVCPQQVQTAQDNLPMQSTLHPSALPPGLHVEWRGRPFVWITGSSILVYRWAKENQRGTTQHPALPPILLIHPLP